ncbi:hypothetical protein [Thermotoga sp. KOL6]|uniref:hypothetical protein n=1 Tax=Thermotoga sp. KOL6 TaxID=126741 RepID=UPI000C76641F|nr:hypothetical protein [Thermotoga sp. KOL6]PLV58687.1 hypothetical protein AS005_07315 [Thermotoga sp. KOL6]
MNRRTVVLLIVMGTVWFVAIFYLLKGNTETISLQESEVNFISLVNKIRVDPELKKFALENPIKSPLSVFNPARLNFGKEAADVLIMTLPTLNYRFLGFIRTNNGIKVFITDGKKQFEVSGDNPVFDNYVVSYVSSLGVLVLDVKNGRFFSIR